MSQSPLEAETRTDYSQGWAALNRLLRSGGSLSGHETNNLYVNCGDGTFLDVAPVAGLDFDEDGRAFATLDFDNDGDLDIILKNRNAPQVRILRNDAAAQNHAIAFDLKGAVGATVTLETHVGRRSRFVRAGSGFLSQGSPVLWFGLGEATSVRSAVIRWPGGARQELSSLAARFRYIVQKGQPEPRAIAFAPARNALKFGTRREGEAPPTRGTWLVEALPAPAFNLPDLTGKRHSLDAHRGRRLLVNFWATWCPPCREELQGLVKHAGELERMGASILAISVDEPDDAAKVREFANSMSPPFPVLLADQDIVGAYSVLNRQVFDYQRDLAVPSTFLIDPNGSIIKVYQGAVPAQQFLDDLDAEPAPLPPGRLLGDPFVRDYGTVGDAFLKAGFSATALDYFEIHRRRQPPTPKLWNNIGVALSGERRLSEAEDAFRKALRADPEFAEARHNLGLALLLHGKLPEARAEFQQALTLGRDTAGLRASLAYIYASTGRIEDAVNAYQAAHRLAPSDPAPLFDLGHLYMEQRQHRNAIYVYERGLQLASGDVPVEVYLNLAAAYEAEGALEKARAAREKAATPQPSLP